MKKVLLSTLFLSFLLFTSCSDDENDKPVEESKEVVTPQTYSFKKDGKSTVSFSGQVARLKMAGELKNALGKNGLSTSTLANLNRMFAEGKGFSSDDLNNSGKKLRSTVASAPNSNLTTQQREELRATMDFWIKVHAEQVIPAKDQDASNGKAGNLDGKRFVNKDGLEANQAVAKTMIGAVILDQIVNKYVSKAFLDAAKSDHEAGKVYKDGANYTKLEHGWDEAYGYVFGLEDDPTSPVNSTDARKGFLNSYLKSVEADADFKGIFDAVNTAFKRGRQAIVVKNYEEMHKQAEIIRTNLSKVVAIRLVHYLEKGKGAKNGSTIHALSEAYGFGYAVMFAHTPSGSQVGYENANRLLTTLVSSKGNLWTISDENLTQLSATIAGYFGFTVEQAAN